MRREIESVPKDGKLIIIEDDARGTYELARWSTEQSAWVGESGKPIPMIPTHWLPLQRDERLLPVGDTYLQKEEQSSGASDFPIQHTFPVFSDRTALEWPPAREDIFALGQDASAIKLPPIEPRTTGKPGPSAWYRFVATSIAVAMIASSLVGMYFRGPIAAYATQYADQYGVASIGQLVKHPTKHAISLPVQELQEEALFKRAPAVQPPGKFDKSSEQTAAWKAMQPAMVSQATEILETERRRLNGWETQLTELPPSMEGRERRLWDVTTTTPPSQEPVGEKRALAAAREDLTMNEAHYRKTLAEERNRSAALASELTTIQRYVETQVAKSNKTANELADLKSAADSAASELQRERERAEALALELAMARREVEFATATSSQKEDEAVQFRHKAETAAAELKQSLQQERQRADTLSSDLGKVRRELDALSILSSQKDDEATQLKRTSETATAELQQSLQQQREEAQALKRELAKMQQSADAQVAKSRKTNEEAATTKQIEIDFVEASRRESTSNQSADYAKVQLKPALHLEPGKTVGNALSVEPLRQAAGTAGTVQSLPMGEPNGSETAGLLARARTLLGQGNIGAARIVLERATETGSAQAAFALAETYDPNILATWRTFGTRGDVMKARDLYERAYDGGLKAAKDRSDALVVGEGGRTPSSRHGREEADR